MFSHSQIIPKDWPVFDEVLVPDPPTLSLAAMPIPPSRASPRNKNPNHIPRPRNAFMLFRSAFAAAQKITTNVEHDNRHITRIIANCWNRLSEAEKQIWRDKAEVEKAQHAERYPDYRFAPVGRAKKPKKRKVRRNGMDEVKRCERIADFVMSGTCGHELESVWGKIEQHRDATPVAAELFLLTSDDKHEPLDLDFPPNDVPPFRSPLLPPPGMILQRVPDTNTHLAHPQTSTDASDDLKSLFDPCYQYYDTLDSSPRFIPPTHYQSVLSLVQSSHAEPEPSTDFAFFSWNQSDSLSFHH